MTGIGDLSMTPLKKLRIASLLFRMLKEKYPKMGQMGSSTMSEPTHREG